VSEIGHLLRLVYLQPALLLVAAADTFASVIAESAFGETLTVHFQTVYFGTLATLLRALLDGKTSRRKIQLLNSAEYLVIFLLNAVLVNQFIEQVLGKGLPIEILFHAQVGN
jgi:hypothetical protein